MRWQPVLSRPGNVGSITRYMRRMWTRDRHDGHAQSAGRAGILDAQLRAWRCRGWLSARTLRREPELDSTGEQSVRVATTGCWQVVAGKLAHNWKEPILAASR